MSGRALLVAAAFALVGAAALALPWWRGPWAGWEVLGPSVTVAVVALAVVAAAAVSRPAAGRVLLAASGAATVSAVAVAVAAWGVAAVPGPVVAGMAGLAVLALVARPPGRAMLACALVAAVGTAVLPGVPRVPPRVVDGPFVRIAVLDPDRPLRSGEPTLPASVTVAGSGLGELDGVPVVFGADGLVAPDASGRARVVARTDGDVVLGVAGGRVARLVGGDALLVTGTAPGDPTRVRVDDVGPVSRVGADGSVWLHARADPRGTVRRLDLGAYGGAHQVPAVYLPVVTIRDPDGADGVDLPDVLPTAGGAALRFAAGPRLERLAPTSTGIAAQVLAGAADPTCGLNAGARTSALTSPGPTAVDADGGIWLAVDGRLARVDPAGGVRAVPSPLPGTPYALVALPDGAIVLGTADALWRLPDAATALADLPPVPAGCVADPPAAGPPVGLVPVANTGGDALGVPLGVDGRWASGRIDGDLAVVGPGGPVTLGPRRDGHLGQVWPDGGGGAWWLEVAGPDGELLTLVHALPGGEQVRSAPVRHPAPREGAALVPDLGGRPPLLATAAGAYRIDGGAPVRVLDGDVAAGVVRADGRGWVLAGGRLLALERDRVLGPVIDPAAGPGSPVPVQLAKGVAPERLALDRAVVGLGADGRAVVVADGVVLRVDDAGAVTVVAQDPRLDAPFTVEGGLVESVDGVLLRIDLP
ncbi:hypothetical protein GCM10017691_46040 [Pseudonocardia petroleophila]|uniref:Uncharacterized protein n=1 Tax=Pseudonocardia petroleophila TaxID=37331 RepID=A0A7G7MQW8_9PSEU|nr:hypothetical protein [Pseudonocardia petroleophila]QNG55179.1 hypothetical protein H6H00_15755 [Pseudonocardia petroleophila]